MSTWTSACLASDPCCRSLVTNRPHGVPATLQILGIRLRGAGQAGCSDAATWWSPPWRREIPGPWSRAHPASPGPGCGLGRAARPELCSRGSPDPPASFTCCFTLHQALSAGSFGKNSGASGSPNREEAPPRRGRHPCFRSLGCGGLPASPESPSLPGGRWMGRHFTHGAEASSRLRAARAGAGLGCAVWTAGRVCP